MPCWERSGVFHVLPFPRSPTANNRMIQGTEGQPSCLKREQLWGVPQRAAKARPVLITFASSLLCISSCICTLSWDFPSVNHCKIILVSGSGSSQPELSHLFNKYLLNTCFVSGFKLKSRDSETSKLWFFLSEIGFEGGTVCRQLMKYEKDHNRGSLLKKKKGYSIKGKCKSSWNGEKGER